MKIHIQLTALILLLSAVGSELSIGLAQGTLTPPGAPAPTMKTLQQIEPRTPISSLPYVISAPGSYYFTTNLTGTGSGNGILISASDVTLDLNGFTLQGTNIANSGIFFAALKETNVSILNGVIRDWPVAGINADVNSVYCRFENLQVARCGQGILAGGNSLVRNCIASGGTGIGIAVLDGGIVDHCLTVSNLNSGIGAGFGSCEIQNSTARYNGNGGITTGPHAMIKNCIADFNQAAGITAGDQTLIDSCYSTSNTGFGYQLGAQCRMVNSFAAGHPVVNIALGAGTLAEGCVSSVGGIGFNAFTGSTLLGCSAISNSTSGFQLLVGSRAVNCQARGTGAGGTSVGISLAGTNAVADGCQVFDNNLGFSAVGGTLVIRNVARANAANYVLPTNCMAGPIISFGSGANTLTGAITNSNPWANFSY